MTYRLVALMTVVLLLSLAAFAFLMDRYQDDVMEEVSRTVSEVGRETLKTAAARLRNGHNEFVEIEAEDKAALSAATKDPVRVREFAGEQSIEMAGAEIQRIIKVRRSDDGHVHETEELVVRSEDGTEAPITWHQERECCACPGDATTPADHAAPVRDVFFMSPGDPKVERLAGHTLTMRIPMLQRNAANDPASGQAQPHVDGQVWMLKTSVEKDISSSPPGAGSAAQPQDISLSFSTSDYTNLYSSVRKRSGFVFLGVFLVGSLLTAGLAARFTRPIRELDRGMRELSDGNLDVHVDVAGRDEIGRLGRGFNEMTRRLRANRERTRELSRGEKHAALGRLAAGVAHDVRNPLHSIGLTLQHIQETCRPEAVDRGDEFDKSVGRIRGEIQRLDELIGNSLKCARSDRIKRDNVDLEQLLRDSLGLVSKEAERRRVELELQVATPVPTIQADPEALSSAVLNLILNSFDAMPDGGRLLLELGHRGDEVHLSVADTGEGIPIEHQEQVFDFAWTTRDGGHGLGLAMVHQVVVEDHGGRVKLDSTVGQGTQLTLVFPLSGASTESAT